MEKYRDLEGNIHVVRKNIFSNIQTEEQAYWLGFFYADGHLCKSKNTVVFAIDIRDLEHLKKLQQYCNYPESSIKTYKNSGTSSYICVFRISSKAAVLELEKLGVTSNKSSSSIMPELNSSLVRHFLRGLFDGDGCISSSLRNTGNTFKTIYEITGSFDLMSSLRTQLVKSGFKNNISVSKTKNCYRLRVSSHAGILEMFYLMYSDFSVCLERKYVKYKELNCLLKIPEKTGELCISDNPR